MHRVADVLIIGAGAAGLATAVDLVRAGIQTLVLEARDRIGGRIHTIHSKSFPLPIEVGAEFIHGKPDEIWRIVSDCRLPVAELIGDNACLEGSDLLQCNEYWADWGKISKRMRLSSGSDEPFLSFSDRLVGEQPHLERARRRAIEFVEGFNAADAAVISLSSLIQDREASETIEGGRSFRLIHGYDRVFDGLGMSSFSSSSIHLSTVVKEIEWKPGHVRVNAIDAKQGSGYVFEAGAVVVTLPLSILQSADGHASVRFAPAIPAKIESARALKMGPVIKVILSFRNSFWRDQDFERLGFVHAFGQPFPVFWTTAPLITPMLAGWASGPSADALAGQTPQQQLDAALKSLSACFGISIRELHSQLIDSFVVDWQADPFSQGGYSYVPAGQLSARQELALPISETVFFAGEATNTVGFGGTVHGAIQTGRRAAREVIDVLKAARRVA